MLLIYCVFVHCFYCNIGYCFLSLSVGFLLAKIVEIYYLRLL